MVITNADKDPANSKVIIFRQFISFEGFTASRDTSIQITAETIANIAITPLDMFNPPGFIFYLNSNTFFH